MPLWASLHACYVCKLLKYKRDMIKVSFIMWSWGDTWKEVRWYCFDCLKLPNESRLR